MKKFILSALLLTTTQVFAQVDLDADLSELAPGVSIKITKSMEFYLGGGHSFFTSQTQHGGVLYCTLRKGPKDRTPPINDRVASQTVATLENVTTREDGGRNGLWYNAKFNILSSQGQTAIEIHCSRGTWKIPVPAEFTTKISLRDIILASGGGIEVVEDQVSAINNSGRNMANERGVNSPNSSSVPNVLQK